jgi:hypothetical protein
MFSSCPVTEAGFPPLTQQANQGITSSSHSLGVQSSLMGHLKATFLFSFKRASLFPNISLILFDNHPYQSITIIHVNIII